MNLSSRASVSAHVVVSPGDEVEVVVVYEIGRVEDAQRGGGDAPAHRCSGDRRVAHRVQHLRRTIERQQKTLIFDHCGPAAYCSDMLNFDHDGPCTLLVYAINRILVVASAYGVNDQIE